MDHEDWSGIFVTLPGVDKAAHMWGGVNDPESGVDGGDAMTHLAFAAATADAQVGRIMDALEETASSTTPSSCSPPTTARSPSDAAERHGHDAHFHGTAARRSTAGSQLVLRRRRERRQLHAAAGPPAAGRHRQPRPVLQRLRSDVWLHDQSPAKVAEAAAMMEQMPDVTAVWRNDGDHFTLVSPVRYDLMSSKAERQWFDKHAQELVDTQAAPYGPDLIATLPDDTTYSVAGDHGGIQRATQQIPIVFAGAGLSSRDIKAPVRSVDIMPTILKAMGITPTYPMDGVAYPLPDELTRSLAGAGRLPFRRRSAWVECECDGPEREPAGRPAVHRRGRDRARRVRGGGDQPGS